MKLYVLSESGIPDIKDYMVDGEVAPDIIRPVFKSLHIADISRNNLAIYKNHSIYVIDINISLVDEVEPEPEPIGHIGNISRDKSGLETIEKKLAANETRLKNLENIVLWKG